MTWTLTDKKGTVVVLDYDPREVLETVRRRSVTAPSRQTKPITVDIGVEAFSISFTVYLVTLTKVDALRSFSSDAGSQPVVLSNAGRYNGSYVISNFRVTERGGAVDQWLLTLELLKV